MGRRANPAFAAGVVAVSIAALAYAVALANTQIHTYIHVMAGVLWTGTDLFIGAVLGPVIGGMDDEESAALFSRLTPKTAFLLPSLAFVTIGAGLTLAADAGLFGPGPAAPWFALFTFCSLVPALLLIAHRLNAWRDRRWQAAFALAVLGSGAWVAATAGSLRMLNSGAMLIALALTTALSVQGFGYLMPGEIRMYKEMTSANPDASLISAIGQKNAMLGLVQGGLQLLLILDMVFLRYRMPLF
jgi:hypothetical protein